MAVTAKATVILEINCKSSWNDETTVAQVKKQAVDDAIGVLNKMANDATYRIKLIGTPDITVIAFND